MRSRIGLTQVSQERYGQLTVSPINRYRITSILFASISFHARHDPLYDPIGCLGKGMCHKFRISEIVRPSIWLDRWVQSRCLPARLCAPARWRAHHSTCPHDTMMIWNIDQDQLTDQSRPRFRQVACHQHTERCHPWRWCGQ